MLYIPHHLIFSPDLLTSILFYHILHTVPEGVLKLEDRSVTPLLNKLDQFSLTLLTKDNALTLFSQSAEEPISSAKFLKPQMPVHTPRGST